ncbi:DNA-deoxyinosine glycosylase [Anaerofustis stercorihominis]|uniref:DNA-deoxyinosine glycosylase n=1 Tax=Anaerofustis stercorihominis TaxID=214853 RepID=UPI00214C0E65|nr:DNA-deoxyinosine glycosylase [Anaerofustis stercorihominis]MCR2032182.1 DNA-deoxyinosine glycosylase [Anaerofustis stercorihominis]
MEYHNIKPVYDKNSKILILGSFPSVKSREAQFFYGHPQNRFWKVISSITDTKLPGTIEDKRKMLINNNIAVWDVVASCDIEGSSDSSIKNVVVNDLSEILKETNIKTIFLNGGTAYNLFKKYNKDLNMNIIKLPSTSPANARYSIEMLINDWNIIKDKL